MKSSYKPDPCVGCMDINITQAEPANMIVPTGITVGGMNITDVAVSLS